MSLRLEMLSVAGASRAALGDAADAVVRFLLSRAGPQGGFWMLHDTMLANLDPSLERRPPAESALEAVQAFAHGLTTREVAVIMAPPLAEPDDRAAAEQLIHFAAEGQIACVPLGSDALWVPPTSGPFERLRAVRELVALGS